MKAKIQAGAELDLLNRAELTEVLGAWATELTRGVKFRQFSGAATVSGGVWTIGGPQADNRQSPLGPEPGFVWAVTRVAASGPGLVAGTDLWSLYVDEVTPSKLIQSGITRGSTWTIGALVLVGGGILTASGAGTGTGDVTLSGGAVELPAQLAWRLL